MKTNIHINQNSLTICFGNVTICIDENGETISDPNKPVKSGEGKNIRIRICPKCLEKFTPTAAAQKFCCKKCKETFKRESVEFTMGQIDESKKKSYGISK